MSMSSRDVEEKHLQYQMASGQLTKREKDEIREELHQNNNVSIMSTVKFDD